MCLILALILSTALLTWITLKFENQPKEFKINISPVFISVNRKWLFMSESADCRETDFCKDFCKISIGIFIASCIQAFGVLCAVFVYIISLIIPSKNLDRLNWIGIFTALFAWIIVTLINCSFSSLTIGFYVMLSLAIFSFFLQLHFIYCSKKVREKILINQLLEA